MHGAGRDFLFTFTRALFVGGPEAGIHRGSVCVSVSYPFIIHLLLLLVPFSFSLSRSPLPQ